MEELPSWTLQVYHLLPRWRPVDWGSVTYLRFGYFTRGTFVKIQSCIKMMDDVISLSYKATSRLVCEYIFVYIIFPLAAEVKTVNVANWMGAVNGICMINPGLLHARLGLLVLLNLSKPSIHITGVSVCDYRILWMRTAQKYLFQRLSVTGMIPTLLLYFILYRGIISRTTSNGNIVVSGEKDDD